MAVKGKNKIKNLDYDELTSVPEHQKRLINLDMAKNLNENIEIFQGVFKDTYGKKIRKDDVLKKMIHAGQSILKKEIAAMEKLQSEV